WREIPSCGEETDLLGRQHRIAAAPFRAESYAMWGGPPSWGFPSEMVGVGEHRRHAAGMDEHDGFVDGGMTGPGEVGQAGHCLAGIDRVQHDPLQRGHQLDRLEHAGGGDPIAGPGKAAADLELVVAQRPLQPDVARAGVRDLAYVSGEGVGLAFDVDPEDL